MGYYCWIPQPGPQSLAIDTAPFVDELLYGGARGGGKSDFLLGDFAQDVAVGYGAAWRGILFRQTYPELEELIIRSKEIFYAMFPGAKYGEASKTWTFPTGETLKMRQLEKPADADKYQGHQYTWIGWDELGQWATNYAFKKLRACLRSAHPIPCKRIRASANPGGPGHHVVKQDFIAPYPQGFTRWFDSEAGVTRMYIPARVSDNQILLKNDPNYVNRLRGVGSDALVKAWLEGDWDVVEGAYFDCWTSDFVLDPFDIPLHWYRFRSFDWGSAKPFSCGWWAVAGEDTILSPGRVIPQGAIVRYSELYGMKAGKPDEGLKLFADEVARRVKAHELSVHKNLPQKFFGHVDDAVADPACFIHNGGPSIAENMAIEGVKFRPGDNSRVPGWVQMRGRMMGDEQGRPMLYVFKNCLDSIRTIPILQHSDKDPEDLDTDGEDHPADDWRYGCMSRPWTRPMPAQNKPFKMNTDRPTFDQLVAEQLRNRKRGRHGRRNRR